MGPLAGMRIIELAGIGPAPFAGMLLADLGATVLRIDRKTASGLGVPRPLAYDIALRNKHTIHVDLKDPAGVELVLDLVARADALIEGFRPGVTERLGLGPDACLQRNPRLVYGRVTGWGQDGPLAQSAGHDINYIAITGALHAIGRAGQPPSVPLNLIGDYAGGSLYLVMGLLAGLLEARASGRGQVVDAAMVDGIASLMAVLVGMREAGMSTAERGANLLDSGAPFYDVYACADGRHVAIGPIEPKFFAELMQRLELPDAAKLDHMDPRHAAELRRLLAERFRTRTRDEWTALFEGTDACVAPVLDLKEAYVHPHLRARRTYLDVDGVMQPAPAPRFSRTAAAVPVSPVAMQDATVDDALRGWLADDAIQRVAMAGTVT
jgi:crotonobetainyl-CoA:carnitine CoA-transferase CaiB-like acyl-CoA transferase